MKGASRVADLLDKQVYKEVGYHVVYNSYWLEGMTELAGDGVDKDENTY